jgi:hypothetical protein
MSDTIPLGFEVGTGRAISIPGRKHLAALGQTQESGKTTTLEGLIFRSGLRAVAFVTKRNEAGFRTAQIIPPYFVERTGWEFVKSLLEATMKTKMKIEESWIITVCKGSRTLDEVHEKVRKGMTTARGMSLSIYTCLDAYFEKVLPQIKRLPYSKTLRLERGVNVMDLRSYDTPVQALVMRSVIEHVYREEENVVVIIPEAWEFIPQDRGSPVKLEAEQFIRKTGASGNRLWIDSQDIAGVEKAILRQVSVWIVGVQREAHEVARGLRAFVSKPARLTSDELMTLRRGEFFVCYGTERIKVYVQPAWMSEAHARAIATGDEPLESAQGVLRQLDQRERGRTPGRFKAAEDAAHQVARAIAPPPSQRMILEQTPPEPAKEPTPSYEPLDVNEPFDYGKENLAPAAPTAPSESGTGHPNQRLSAEGPLAVGSRAPTMVYLEHAWDEMHTQFLIAKIREAFPTMLSMVTDKPELEIRIQRPKLELDGNSVQGRLAQLIAEGFLDAPRTGTALQKELARRGFKQPTTNIYDAANRLAKLGFLTNEGKAIGYQRVAGMKITQREQES